MISEMFGEKGPFRKKTRGWEFREGQGRMADAVAEAITGGHHLACEAPCGIGKTYAYLVPAILHALETDTRVIVCTANIALQEQIFEKDLPALRKILPERFTYSLLKGINNYLCLDRFTQTQGELADIVFDRTELRHWKKIEKWRDDTPDGDISDLEFTPADAVWSRVNGASELCNGSQCLHYEDCFAMDARRKARGAQVIVTNYHLFFAHLRLRASGAGDVLMPEAPVVICDEAQEMADIARDFFGRRLTPYSVNALVQGANWIRRGGAADRLRRASREFFDRIRGHRERRIRTPNWTNADGLLEAVGELRGLLDDRRKETEDEAETDKIAKFQAAAVHYEETLRAFLAADDPNLVYWIQKDPRAARLYARVIDVAEVLREELFNETRSVILTSATLSAGGKFDFIRRETGAVNAEAVAVDSPFDFGEQAAVIVPRMKAAPNDPQFAPEMSGHINRILETLGGRTMCLFTSYRNLEACADAAEATGVKILRQGARPRSKLLAEFRKDRGSALFATASFWQGVDIPGEALSCLVIDKIPFMNPSDPLMEALQERDPSSFSNYSLPKAILDLRQGFGRLIRRRTDRGVVVIFDNRLFQKAYGHTVLSSLPGAPVLREPAALEKFFKSAAAPIE